MALFTWWERRSARAMLPVRLFGEARFTVPNVCSFVLGFDTSVVFCRGALRRPAPRTDQAGAASGPAAASISATRQVGTALGAPYWG